MTVYEAEFILDADWKNQFNIHPLDFYLSKVSYAMGKKLEEQGLVGKAVHVTISVTPWEEKE